MGTPAATPAWSRTSIGYGCRGSGGATPAAADRHGDDDPSVETSQLSSPTADAAELLAPFVGDLRDDPAVLTSGAVECMGRLGAVAQINDRLGTATLQTLARPSSKPGSHACSIGCDTDSVGEPATRREFRSVRTSSTSRRAGSADRRFWRHDRVALGSDRSDSSPAMAIVLGAADGLMPAPRRSIRSSPTPTAGPPASGAVRLGDCACIVNYSACLDSVPRAVVTTPAATTQRHDEAAVALAGGGAWRTGPRNRRQLRAGAVVHAASGPRRREHRLRGHSAEC